VCCYKDGAPTALAVQKNAYPFGCMRVPKLPRPGPGNGFSRRAPPLHDRVEPPLSPFHENEPKRCSPIGALDDCKKIARSGSSPVVLRSETAKLRDQFVKNLTLLTALVCFAATFYSYAQTPETNHTVVRFDVLAAGTNFGKLDMELFDQEKPETVKNFLLYVYSGA
jgi:hypothetical protein